MQIKSSAFAHQKAIPRKYTCDGEDLSPPLAFEGVPKDAMSLAIIVDDPDAPSGTFTHWIAWNIPGDTQSLAEGAKVPKEGKNHFGKSFYRGPCPPHGNPHHYHFKVYALDQKLNLPVGSSKEEFEEAMDGHILSQAELVGTYQRK